MSLGVPTMGCQNPFRCVKEILTINLLVPVSGGLANILNKQHNSSDCSEPPDHLNFLVVFI